MVFWWDFMCVMEERQSGRVRSRQALLVGIGLVGMEWGGRGRKGRKGKYPLAPERAKAVRVSLPRPRPALLFGVCMSLWVGIGCRGEG